MEQQTAIEWFMDNIPTRFKNVLLDMCKHEIKQAKEMEKQQIIDAFGVGCHLESKRLIGYHDVAEQYYNETYNKL